MRVLSVEFKVQGSSFRVQDLSVGFELRACNFGFKAIVVENATKRKPGLTGCCHDVFGLCGLMTLNPKSKTLNPNFWVMTVSSLGLVHGIPVSEVS